MNGAIAGLLVILVVLLFTGGVSTIRALFGSFGRLLKNAVGMADTIFVTASEQIETCKNEGWLNIGKGCIVGIAAIGYAMAIAIGWGVQTYSSFRAINVGADANSAAAQARDLAVRLGADHLEVAKDFNRAMKESIAALEQRGIDPNTNPRLTETVVNTAMAERGNRIATAEAEKNPNVEARRQAMEPIEANRELIKEKFRGGMEDIPIEERRIGEEVVREIAPRFEPRPLIK